MLQDTGRIVKEKRNYHMTTEELQLMFKYLNRWSSKIQLLVAICAFRGLRVSEALAINILDFDDASCDKLTYREAKTNKLQYRRPIIKPLADMIKGYIVCNRHLLKDGYLFPYYTSKKRTPHMTSETAGAFMAKIRRMIGKDRPEFLDRYTFQTEAGKTLQRYRIGFHSLRRWFENHLHTCSDVYTVKEVMNYCDYEPLNAYLNRQKVLDREPKILENAFAPLLNDLKTQCQGQSK